jgi:hypothetical protein
MDATVAQMTQEELQRMLERTIEQKLLELLGDPDEGLEIRKVPRDRLLRQRQAIAAGAIGEPLEVVAQRLGLG